MTNDLLLLFLLAHITADFYLQTQRIADEKDKKIRLMLLHGLIYLVVSVVVIIPVFSPEVLLAAVAISLIHLIVDFIKMIIKKRCMKNGDKSRFKKWFENGFVFVVDQIIHILSIVLVCVLFGVLASGISTAGWVTAVFAQIGVSKVLALKITLLLLLLAKPINLTFKKTFEKPKDKDKKNTRQQRMGARIGVLERFLILIFLIVNQYAAIGLVLTAKSIARYKKISTDKKFGEYYLCGTLFSVLAVVVSYLVIW